MADPLPRVLALATAFRAAVEAHHGAGWPRCFARFPRGCCGPSADVLGVLLWEAGLPGFVRIAGSHRGPRAPWPDASHCWLEGHGLVVDVTADQFEDGPGPVFVAATSPWHQRFLLEDARGPSFNTYDDPAPLRLALADLRAAVGRIAPASASRGAPTERTTAP